LGPRACFARRMCSQRAPAPWGGGGPGPKCGPEGGAATKIEKLLTAGHSWSGRVTTFLDAENKGTAGMGLGRTASEQGGGWAYGRTPCMERERAAPLQQKGALRTARLLFAHSAKTDVKNVTNTQTPTRDARGGGTTSITTADGGGGQRPVTPIKARPQRGNVDRWRRIKRSTLRARCETRPLARGPRSFMVPSAETWVRWETRIGQTPARLTPVDGGDNPGLPAS